MENRIREFLERHRFFYEDMDFDGACDAFIGEMKNGLEGRGSLAMLPTYITLDGSVDYGRNVIVMDAGGTNFRVALVHFDDEKKAVVDYLQSGPMPGTTGEIGRDEFYSRVTEALLPVIDKSDRIGFCFSYPTEILPDRDGKLLHFNKEVHIRGLTGEKIGAGLLEALKKRGVKGEKRVVLINDTVATLLGGKTAVNDRVFDSYIGFILGTGTNTCYIEENRNILKDAAAGRMPGSMIVNIESGGYAGIPRSDFDEMFDKGTETPGAQPFEKMISGAYQGEMLLAILRQAAAEGLFTAGTAKNIGALAKLSSREIDLFCLYPDGDNALARAAADAADKLTVYGLADAFFSRAAFLVAVNLASVLLKTGKGKNPLRPVCVSAEGTTFYKSRLFRPKLDALVAGELNRRLGLYCEFVRSENTTIVGSALAGILD